MICAFCVYMCMCMVYNMVMYELLCTIVYILSELLLAASCVQCLCVRKFSFVV